MVLLKYVFCFCTLTKAEELFCLEHTPCQNGGTCLQDGSYNYTCSCPAGYSGTHCEVPLCHNHFCLHGGVCQIAEGTRYCLCPPPFAGPRCQHRPNHRIPQSSSVLCNGPECSYTNFPVQEQTFQLQSACKDASCFSEFLKPVSCQGQLCYNKGTCILPTGSQRYECRCQFPFTGPQCLQVRDPCQSSPCKNGAVCKLTDPNNGSFICQCTPGYFGDMCDYEKSVPTPKNTTCDENVICQNGGMCERWQRSGQFLCKCSPEFTGEFCEIGNTDSCSTHTCLNGGTCVVAQNSEPMCVCEEGYTGNYCQSFTDSVCSRVVCQNGGTCLEHDGEFVCSCRKKFEGIFCEKRFKRRETALTVRLETLTVREENIHVKFENAAKSAGAMSRTNFLTVVGVLIVCNILSRAFDETHK